MATDSINLGKTKSFKNEEYEQASVQERKQNMGDGSKPPPERCVPLEEPSYCKVLKNDHGAEIVLTKDTIGNFRHSDGKDKSGYGPHFPHAAAVDIVVGRGGAYARENRVEAGKAMHASFKGKYSDAARIYVSQLCDVDHAFTLPHTNMQSAAKSAIAMKADAIRIIGDEGVKIIARSDSTNSHGRDVGRSGIHLIANPGIEGEIEPMSPLVRGDRLCAALIESNKNTQKMCGMVGELILQMQTLIVAFNSHFHMDTGPAAPSTVTPMQIATKPVNIALNDLATKVAYHTIAIQNNSINYFGLDGIASTAPAQTYICSRYNKTN
jgi:hypothetical protein